MTSSLAQNSSTAAHFRTPTTKDAVDVWQMVLDEPMLDDNSSYYYQLWFRDFAETSMVATAGDEIVAFATGYRRPGESETYFIWQAAVKPASGISGLGIDILVNAIDIQVAAGARYVETSVSADNKAITMLLHMVAKKYATAARTELLFPVEELPGGDHDEVLFRIGPLTPRV